MRSAGRSAWTKFDIAMSAVSGRDRDSGVHDAYRSHYRERFVGGNGVAYRTTTLRSWIAEDGPSGTTRWTWVDTHVDGVGLLGWTAWEAPPLVREVVRTSESPTVDGDSLLSEPIHRAGTGGGLDVAERMARRGRTMPLILVCDDIDPQTRVTASDSQKSGGVQRVASLTAGIATVFTTDTVGARAVERALEVEDALNAGTFRMHLGGDRKPASSVQFVDIAPHEHGLGATAAEVCGFVAPLSTHRQSPFSSTVIDSICPPPESIW